MNTEPNSQTASDPAVACTGLLACIEAVQIQSGFHAGKWVCRRLTDRGYDYVRGRWWVPGSQAWRYRNKAAALRAGNRLERLEKAIHNAQANVPAQRPPAKDV